MNYRMIVILGILLSSAGFGLGQNWDVAITKAVNPQHPESGYWKMTSSSAYIISAALPVTALTAGILKNDRTLKMKGSKLFGAVIIEVLATETVKRIIDRKRPAQSYPGFIFPYQQLNGKSFPSGHSSLAFATAASLSIQFKKWYVTCLAYLWATSVGYSRLYLGVHYPSDVITGAAAGIGSAYLSDWLHRKIFPKKKEAFYK